MRIASATFYRTEWGEGANHPLLAHFTPRLTTLHVIQLSLVSLSQLGVQSTHVSPYFFCPVFPAPVFRQVRRQGESRKS